MAKSTPKYDVELSRKDEAAFKAACLDKSTKSMRIHMCKIKDWTPLSRLSQLERLAIVDFSHGRLETLASLARLKQLKLMHFPKVHDLTPLQSLARLEELAIESLPSWFFNGKFMQWESVEPLSKLKRLRRLQLGKTRIEHGGLYPIAKLQRLEELFCCNDFSIEEFAYLSAKLPRAVGPGLKPFHPTMGRKCKKCGDVMVSLAGVHSRGRIACPRCDADRLAAHTAKFNQLKERMMARA